jgi:phage terminase large subunit-like protein
MSSELYGQLFGAEAQPGGKSTSGTDFMTAAGGKYKAVGVGGSLTGFGGDLIIGDDLIKSAETADSPVYKAALEKYFSETLYTRLMPNGKIIIMATRWRADDLLGYILKNFADWEYVNLPSIAEEEDMLPSIHGMPQVDMLGRSIGDPLWPDFFKTEDLVRTKGILGERSFSALYQGRPVSAKGGKISAADLMWSDTPLDKTGDSSLTELYSFWSWDTALTATQTADWTVGQYWTVYTGGKLWQSKYVRMRGDFTEVQAAIETCYEEGGDFVLIEHSHTGLNLKSQLAKDYPNMLVELFKPRDYGDKMARLQAALPSFKSGKVWFAREALSANEDFDACLDELLKALMTSNDDYLDTTTQAILYVNSRDGAGHTILGRKVGRSQNSKLPSVSKLGRKTALRLAGKWR